MFNFMLKLDRMFLILIFSDFLFNKTMIFRNGGGEQI